MKIKYIDKKGKEVLLNTLSFGDVFTWCGDEYIYIENIHRSISVIKVGKSSTHTTTFSDSRTMVIYMGKVVEFVVERKEN